MTFMNISVNGQNISMRGRVEARGAWLSVPNSLATQRLLKLLVPSIEGEQPERVVVVDGKLMPREFVLHVRASHGFLQEG